MRYLLDTSALIAHHRREAGADEVQALFADEDAEIYISSVSLAEFGRRLREFKHNREETQDVLRDYGLLVTEIVGVDAKIAMLALSLSEASLGRVPLIDTLITACAASVSATLVHRDKHMAGLPVTQMFLSQKAKN